MSTSSEIRKIAFLGDYLPRSLLRGRQLVIPYAMSDYATTFATVSLDEVLERMRP